MMVPCAKDKLNIPANDIFAMLCRLAQRLAEENIYELL